MTQASEDDIRRAVELSGIAYAAWEKEAIGLRSAADGAELGRLVDRHHLIRAGEIATAIESEIAGLDELYVTATGETLAQLQGVTDRLRALLKDIRQSARILHGVT